MFVINAALIFRPISDLVKPLEFGRIVKVNMYSCCVNSHYLSLLCSWRTGQGIVCIFATVFLEEVF